MGIDSEDLSNAALKINWINCILKIVKQTNKYVILNCNNIVQYYSFYCIFDKINAVLVSIRFLTSIK